MNSREGSKKEERGSEQDHRQTSDGLNANPPGGAGVGRCWGRSTSSGGRRTGVVRGDRGRSGTHGLGTESLEGVGSARFSVDGEHHSAGTVVTLGTVNPNRVGVIHGDGESGEVGNIISNGFESRFEAAGQRLARIAEGGLSGGVVFLTELEGDGVSRLGNNVAGIEQETTRTTDNNTVVRTSGRSGGR